MKKKLFLGIAGAFLFFGVLAFNAQFETTKESDKITLNKLENVAAAGMYDDFNDPNNIEINSCPGGDNLCVIGPE